MANTIVCSWHIRPWTARSLRETHRPQLKRRIRSRSSPAAGATIVTDTRAEAYLEQMIILRRAWINATVTGPDPRTSRAAEHNCPSLSFTRGRPRWNGTSCRSTVFYSIRRRAGPCLSGLRYSNRLGCIGRTKINCGGTCSSWPTM